LAISAHLQPFSGSNELVKFLPASHRFPQLFIGVVLTRFKSRCHFGRIETNPQDSPKTARFIQ
jgi:hypothetical protein